MNNLISLVSAILHVLATTQCASLEAARLAKQAAHDFASSHEFPSSPSRRQSVRQNVQVIFDDLIKLFQATPEGQARTAQITRRLLALDWRIKGRYGLLGKLARTLGSETLLRQSPQLKVSAPVPPFFIPWPTAAVLRA